MVILNNQKATFMEVSSKLKSLFDDYGLGLLQEKQRLNAMISDLFYYDYKLRKLLLLSVQEEIPQKIAILANDKEQDFKIKQIQNRWVEECSLQEIIATQMVEYWRKALEIQDPDETIMIVKEGEHYGYLSSKRGMITDFRYNLATNFINDFAVVMVGFSIREPGRYGDINKIERWGIIDKSGQEIIKLKYSKLKLLNGDIAIARFQRNWGVINMGEQEVVSFIYDELFEFGKDLFVIKQNGKYGIINRKGKEITPLTFNKLRITINTGLAEVELNNKYGLIDSTGKKITPIKYDRINDYCEGLSCVFSDKLYGFIDNRGNEIIPLKYNFANDFQGDKALVEINKSYKFINKCGEIIKTLKYEYVDTVIKDSIIRVKYSGKWGLIDMNGNEITRIIYDTIGGGHPYAKVSLNDKWGLIDNKGEVKFPIIYNEIGYGYKPLFSGEYTTLAKQNDKYFMLDITGKKTPLKYSNKISFCEDLAMVEYNGKWGFIDRDGRETILTRYDSVAIFFKIDKNDYFSERLAWVKLNGKCGFINQKGEEVIHLKYDKAEWNNYDQKANVEIDGRFAKVDLWGFEKFYNPFLF